MQMSLFLDTTFEKALSPQLLLGLNGEGMSDEYIYTQSLGNYVINQSVKRNKKNNWPADTLLPVETGSLNAILTVGKK